MLLRITALLIATALTCEAQVTVSVSLQPLEAWRAVIGKRLKNTAVYDATVCNAGTVPVVVPSGRIFSAARTHIATVSPLLVPGTLNRAQQRTHVYRMVQVLTFASWAVGVAVTTGSIQMPENVRIALPLSIEAMTHLSGDLKPKVPSVDRSAFLSEAPVMLPGGACESRLMLGEYRPDVSRFEVEIH